MTAAATAPDTGTAAPSSRGALSKLIQDANDRGLSYAKMAGLAADPETGLKLSKPYLARLVTNPGANPRAPHNSAQLPPPSRPPNGASRPPPPSSGWNTKRPNSPATATTSASSSDTSPACPSLNCDAGAQ